MSPNIGYSHSASTASSFFDLFADTAARSQLAGIVRVLFMIINDTQQG